MLKTIQNTILLILIQSFFSPLYAATPGAAKEQNLPPELEGRLIRIEKAPEASSTKLESPQQTEGRVSKQKREEFFREQYVQEQMAAAPLEPATMSTNQTSTTLKLDSYQPQIRDFYMALNGGGISYPDVSNVPVYNGAGGVALGFAMTQELWLEGSFLYSFQQIDINQISSSIQEDVDYLAFSGGMKYTFGYSQSSVTPYIGGLLTFSRRLFNAGENNSNAFDGGLLAGLDFAVTKKFILGVEGRYMTNFSHERDIPVTDDQLAAQRLNSGKEVRDLETFDYLVMLLQAKFYF